MKEHQENENSPLELAVLAGKILLSNGAEIFRVQETMERIAASYHMDTFHVYAISNGIFACGTENGVAHTAEIRHVPLSPADPDRMLRSLKCYKLLTGYRGSKPANIAQLREILMAVNRLLLDFPAICEMDINPLIFDPDREQFFAVDARIKLS